MENENLIPLHLVCQHYSIEFSFVQSLHECGLLQISKIDENMYLVEEQIGPLERFIRLHYDLDINIEGLEVVDSLIQRVDDLQEELRIARNRLRLYESE